MLESTPAMATAISVSISVNPAPRRRCWADRVGEKRNLGFIGFLPRSATRIAGDGAFGRARTHSTDDVDDVMDGAASGADEAQRAARRARAVQRIEDDRGDVAGDAHPVAAREGLALDRAGASAAHGAGSGAAAAVGGGAAVDDPASRTGAGEEAETKRPVARDRLAARELDVGGEARRRALEPARLDQRAERRRGGGDDDRRDRHDDGH